MSADPDILLLILMLAGAFWFMTPRILMEPLDFYNQSFWS